MKTRMTPARRALVAMLMLVATACTGTRVTIPNVPARPYDETKGHRVFAESSGFQLLLWIPIGVNDRHEECLQALRNQAPGQFVTDVKVQDSWTYALVGTIYSVSMEGMAYPYISP